MTKRLSKREAIYRLFHDARGTKFDSLRLHNVFGTSFRSRVSEINNGPYDIYIENYVDENDRSVYWAHLRLPVVVAA